MEQNNTLESDREELMLAGKSFWCKFAFFSLLLKTVYRTLSYIKILLDQNEEILQKQEELSERIKQLAESSDSDKEQIVLMTDRVKDLYDYTGNKPNQKPQNLMRRPSAIIQEIKDAEYIKEHGDREGDTN